MGFQVNLSLGLYAEVEEQWGSKWTFPLGYTPRSRNSKVPSEPLPWVMHQGRETIGFQANLSLGLYAKVEE